MKLCYALRRGVFYPSQIDEFGTLPPREHRAAYLGLVRSIGFEGVEVGVDEAADERCARELASELDDAGLRAICVRAGGALAHPLAGPKARQRMVRAVRYARWLGAEVVNTAIVSPAT